MVNIGIYERRIELWSQSKGALGNSSCIVSADSPGVLYQIYRQFSNMINMSVYKRRCRTGIYLGSQAKDSFLIMSSESWRPRAVLSSLHIYGQYGWVFMNGESYCDLSPKVAWNWSCTVSPDIPGVHDWSYHRISDMINMGAYEQGIVLKF